MKAHIIVWQSFDAELWLWVWKRNQYLHQPGELFCHVVLF